ncbi:hypothetical protein IE81DRAFT_340516 [Ceraceosorus guamensis]|uniref:Uncharacterized protein n=1 Tax=Ceraceosorus guamensis TaxID=1522189 RepID=A0A316W1V6_9BASI|nr:hypothetical protein IE81DRAFT_340516 [Ceraceosorus guamensis]PWN43877.1 hypothetical protein IE81DRAFT_340516 [Ceraceosorus guamensis]
MAHTNGALFAFPRARILQYVPQAPSNARRSGYSPCPRPFDGLINPGAKGVDLSQTAILKDVSGALQICAVPDPARGPAWETLLILLDPELGAGPGSQGQQERMILPWKLIDRSSERQGDRELFEGLGAGTHGRDGGSLWFHLDPLNVGGQGIICEIWLIGAPAPLVTSLRTLLITYPSAQPPLPPWLNPQITWPWRDNYLSIQPMRPPQDPLFASAPTMVESAAKPDDSSGLTQAELLANAGSSPRVLANITSVNTTVDTTIRLGVADAQFPIAQNLQTKSTPTIGRIRPALPPKPDSLKSPPLSPTTPSVRSGVLRSLDAMEDPNAMADRSNTETDERQLSEASSESSESRHDVQQTESIDLSPYESPSLAEPVDVPSPAVSRSTQSQAADDSIEQLTAVDPPLESRMTFPHEAKFQEAITSAEDARPASVLKNLPRRRPRPPGSAGASAATAEQATLRADYRNSLVAIDNETGTVIGVLARDVYLGQDAPPDCLAGSALPQQEAKAIRPVSKYVDEGRVQSRPPSVLREETFAPPPVPTKEDWSQSTRDSMADAQFFSAVEGETENETETETETQAGARGTYEHVKHGEVTRPDLLRDAHRMRSGEQNEEDYESDASGSTIGGPAVRVWRKARGLPRAEGRRKRREESEASDRTSKAVTAISGYEGDADVELHEEAEQDLDVALEALDGDTEQGEPTPMPSRFSEPTRRPLSRLDPLSAPSISKLDAEEEAEESTQDASEQVHLIAPESGTVKLQRKQLALHGHLPRALMRTEKVWEVEDEVWKDALETGSLPVQGHYTHLAAHGTSDASEEQQATREVAAANSAGAMDGVLQGGTVLIQFLAGSKVGASLVPHVPSAGLSDVTNILQLPSDEEAPLRKGAMAYIPVLPKHFLWWLGITPDDASTTRTKPINKPNALSDETSPSVQELSRTLYKTGTLDEGLAKTLLSGVTDGMYSAWEGVSKGAGWVLGSTFGWSSSPSHSSSSASAADRNPLGPIRIFGSTEQSSESEQEQEELDLRADEDAKEEEYEWAVPDFDPLSLEGTPRPIYRRKKAMPSPFGGFGIRESDDSQQQQPRSSKDKFTVLHFDSNGFGRRTIVDAHGLPSF